MAPRALASRTITTATTTLVSLVLASGTGVQVATASAGPQTVVHIAAAPVDAADPEALSAAAVEAFSDKRYDEAVTLFEQAYDADPQPNYLFNIGRVHEEKGDLPAAIEYYSRFVGESGVDIEARQNAAARLKVLKEAVAALEPAAQREQPEPPTEQSEPADPPASSETDEPTDAKKKLRIAGYSLIGVGGAALIVGAVFGGLALGKTRSADDEPFVDEAARLRRDARSQARVADAMYITGGILAGAGVVMVLTTLGRRSGKASAARNVAPMVGPGRAGLSLSGRF